MKRGIVALTGLAVIAGCTTATPERDRSAPPTTAIRLVAFDSCAEALADLRAAARKSVDPWGLPGDPRPQLLGAEGGSARSGATPADAPPQHSATNNHESDADEPDVVKTDGTRIVTLTSGVLRVVDASRRTQTGRLDLRQVTKHGHWWSSRLLLHDGRAIVLTTGMYSPAPGIRRSDVDPSIDTRALLIDLAGTPRLLGSYRIDGDLVDARKIGDTARVVVRSRPLISFPPPAKDATDAERIAANQATIDRAPVEDWLPRYEWTDGGGQRQTGQLPCNRLSRPTGHSGSALLNLLSFDLGAGKLGDGEPASVVAEGDTVYGTGTSLYVADTRGPMSPALRMGGPRPPAETVVHRFDLTSPGQPRYTASGSVPGHLLNQYALSEWEGHLRVATTSDPAVRSGDWGTSSAVYVLRTDGDELRQVGMVDGLGQNERIYSVRFLGDTGYVVTFRETDPLYSLDLRDPTSPRVTGELKITGYSGHLQPVGEGRLLGIGQEADERGARQGLLVSLFDVTDPAKPTRLDHYHLPGWYSAAEHDPHALLFWPASGLVVLPVSGRGPRGSSQETLALRIDGSDITELGRFTQPGEKQRPVLRSLIVGDTLWTLSDRGLQASDPIGLTTRGWIPAT
jgi:hypothetical protein